MEIYDHYVVLERDGHSARLYLRGEAQPDARSAQGLLTVGGTPETAAVTANSRRYPCRLPATEPGLRRQSTARVSSTRADSAPFSQLGLQPGDVLTRIKGDSISDALRTTRDIADAHGWRRIDRRGRGVRGQCEPSTRWGRSSGVQPPASRNRAATQETPMQLCRRSSPMPASTKEWLMKYIFFALIGFLASGWAGAQAPNAWSTQDYDFYAGDFNGAGFTDVLFIAHSPSMPSGILLSDGTAPTILGQTWASNYLGISGPPMPTSCTWETSTGTARPTSSCSRAALGQLSALDRQLRAHQCHQPDRTRSRAGLAWSTDEHHLVVGDFNGDGHADLFFQPTMPGGMSAVVYADANGQFTSITPAQIWADGALGFNWSVSDANVYAGDFNGDGRADLLIQAQPIERIANTIISLSYPQHEWRGARARGRAALLDDWRAVLEPRRLRCGLVTPHP